jgi:type IV pilus assembly protein PilB
MSVQKSSKSKIILAGLPGKLVKDGLISRSDAEKALEKSRAEHTCFVNYVVSNKLISSEFIALAAAEEFGIPLIDIESVDITPDIIKLIDEKLLKKHKALPLFKRGKRLFVAISDPNNLSALDDIRFRTNLNTEAILAREDHLSKRVEKAIQSFEDTGMDNLGEELADIKFEDSDDEENKESGEAATSAAEEAPVVKFVNKMLLDAIRLGASDLHFEPYEKFYRVRYRVDGVLKQVAKPPLGISKKLAARIKVMARLDVAERRVPQDGRIKLHLNAKKSIDFRVSTCPTLWGEKIVMRILDSSAANLNIDILGYEDDQKRLYLEALENPYGMILVTGPTGSGKTVSLYTGIGILNKEGINISTAEDPVEINLPGVNQVQIDDKTGMTFSKALKAFLRQDPDVILVGEIRDIETGSIAIKAASTGHLVLSTLHTNDAPQTLTRLVDMGIKPFAIATAVNLIIAQRLCRRLCSCKIPQKDIPKEILLEEGFSEADVEAGFQLYAPKIGGDCEKCGGAGYKGRAGIYQVMPISEEMKRLILKGSNAIGIADQARKEGIPDLRESGLKKVKDGITSLEEVNRVVSKE